MLVFDGAVFQLANSDSIVPAPVPPATEVAPGVVQLASAILPGNNAQAVSPDRLIQYVADKVTGLWKNKGLIDCSVNPVYPFGTVGDAYTVSVAGRIGGPGGIPVVVRDVIYCIADAVEGHSSTSANWNIIQANVVQATEAIAGFARVATQDDVTAGLDDTRFITSLKLKTLLNTLIKPMRTQLRFYSDSIIDTQITPAAIAAANVGVLFVTGIPAGATIFGASLVWTGVMRNMAAAENGIQGGHIQLSNSGPFENFLDVTTMLRLEANQITSFALVAQDVTSIVTGNGTYLAQMADIRSQVASLFMSGYWMLQIDYQAN